MAYIDVETNIAKYRVLVGNHDRRIPKGLLSERSHALMVELVLPHTSDPASNLAEIIRYDQYFEITEKALSRGTFVAMAEPLYTQNGRDLVLESHERSSNGGFLLNSISRRAGNSDIPLSYNGLFYRLLEHARDQQTLSLEEEEKLALFGIRDTVIAERAFRLGLRLATPGDQLRDFVAHSIVDKPVIDISVGTNHLGVARKLHMKPEDRVQFLRDNMLQVSFMHRDEDLFNMYFANWVDNNAPAKSVLVRETQL